jgi:hypothetical protein
MLGDFSEKVKWVKHLKVPRYSGQKWHVAGEREGKAIRVRCPIENLPVFSQRNHSRKWKWAAGDVLDEPLHPGMIPGSYPYRIVDAEPGVFPPAHPSRNTLGYLHFVKQQAEHPLLPELRGPLFPDVGNVDKVPGIRKHAFRDYRMNMGMPVDKVPERLDRVQRAIRPGGVMVSVRRRRPQAGCGYDTYRQNTGEMVEMDDRWSLYADDPENGIQAGYDPNQSMYGVYLGNTSITANYVSGIVKSDTSNIYAIRAGGLPLLLTESCQRDGTKRSGIRSASLPASMHGDWRLTVGMDWPGR